MDALKAAIAQIKVGSSRGTGFLVSDDGLVLTALHVIADRDECKRKGALVPYRGQITLRFGDPKSDAVWAPSGPATIEPGRYSVEDDWVLLRVPTPVQAAPLTLARLASSSTKPTFTTFGFPGNEAEIGGDYDGTVGSGAKKMELTSPQILAGAPMGGLSGAPCVVEGRVVGVIVQALLDEQGGARKPTIYAIPIEYAARGGRLAWDCDDVLPFEPEVRTLLPRDEAALAAAARSLGLPIAQAGVGGVARRILRARVVPDARDALGCCAVKPADAAQALGYVAAMQLPEEAVARLADATERLAPALLRAVEDRVAFWYERRARWAKGGAHVWVNDTVVVPSLAGHEEAGGDDPDAAASAVLAAIEAAARKKWPTDRLFKRFRASARAPGTEFCVLLHDELRFDVLERVRARLPNAHLLVVTADDVALRDEDLPRVTPVVPALSPQEEDDLLTALELAQSALAPAPETA
ncbi:MAG: serine protease [Polyangiales bacterium]